MMGRLFVVIFAVALLVCQFGCWAPKSPETRLGVNVWTHTWEFSDTKDNSVTIKNAKYDPVTKEASVELVQIENSASTVIQQQIEQMKIWNLQMQTANEGIRATLLGLTQLANQFTSILAGARLQTQLDTPMGKGAGDLQLGPGALLPSAATQPTVPQ
jgi:hypothetical protein